MLVQLPDIQRFARVNITRMVLTEPYFWFLRKRARGMLPPLAYRMLYELALDLPDLPFVDIGAGAGASTIALARAGKDSHKRAPVISIERCTGVKGSRARYGGFEENHFLLTSNLARFGVVEHVRLFAKYFGDSSAEELLSMVGSARIAGFMHDADGRLDRDCCLFWPMVVPGGLIVVDDYESLDTETLIARTPRSARKKLMIRRGLDLLMDAGMFVPEWRCGNTMFGRRPDGVAPPPALFDDLKDTIETASREVRERLEQGSPS